MNIGRQFEAGRCQRHRATLTCAQAFAVCPMVLGGRRCLGPVMVLGALVRPGHLVLRRPRPECLGRRAGVPERKPTASEPRKQEGQEDGERGKAGAWHQWRI